MANAGGYGICGHKNSFSSKVKEGNWSEDHFGDALSRSRVERTKHVETSEHLSNFRNPATVPLKDAREGLPVEVKARGGLDRTVLFNHGPDIFKAVEQVRRRCLRLYLWVVSAGDSTLSRRPNIPSPIVCRILPVPRVARCHGRRAAEASSRSVTPRLPSRL